jgi:hypothetical protein
VAGRRGGRRGSRPPTSAPSGAATGAGCSGGATDEPLHTLCVFGPARDGKSFLANKLLGGREPTFQVGDANHSCTNGVDLSTRCTPLRQFVSGGGAPAREHSETGLVALLDTEGRGARGDEYNVHLVSPLLLVASVVVFNWKGRPRPQDVLTTRRFLCDAARGVDERESGRPGDKTFGHLHTVLRDVVGVTDVESLVVREERGRSADVTGRNETRRVLTKAFVSVKFWGLPPPVESATEVARGTSVSLTRSLPSTPRSRSCGQRWRSRCSRVPGASVAGW